MKLKGHEVTVDADRLHAVRLAALALRFYDDADTTLPDRQAQIRMSDGKWLPASRITATDPIAVRGRG